MSYLQVGETMLWWGAPSRDVVDGTAHTEPHPDMAGRGKARTAQVTVAIAPWVLGASMLECSQGAE